MTEARVQRIRDAAFWRLVEKGYRARAINYYLGLVHRCIRDGYGHRLESVLGLEPCPGLPYTP
jgi:hypothetical protein